MIRCLHLGDLHLGVPSPYPNREADFWAALDRALELIPSVDICLWPGDIFHHQQPHTDLVNRWAQRVRAAAEHCPQIIIPGNHDCQTRADHLGAGDIFSSLATPNVHVFRTPDVLPVVTRKGYVLLAALPFAPKARLLAQEELRGKNAAEVTKQLTEIMGYQLELLAEKVGEWRSAPETSPWCRDAPAILVGHWSVEGCTTGGWKPMGSDTEVVLPLSAVQNPAFDYCAFAHIHLHQALGAAQPPVVYPGSLERVDFGEEKEERVVVVAEVERGHATWKTVPTSARPFRTFELGETADPVAALAERGVTAIRNGERGNMAQDAICRVKYSLPPGAAAPSDREIRKFLMEAGAAHVATITRERPVREMRAQSTEVAQAETPAAALDAYLATRADLGDSKPRIRELGLQLIEEQLVGA